MPQKFETLKIINEFEVFRPFSVGHVRQVLLAFILTHHRDDPKSSVHIVLLIAEYFYQFSVTNDALRTIDDIFQPETEKDNR